MDFTGEESESEFYTKSLEYWDTVADLGVSDTRKLIKIATIFREIRHRLNELEQMNLFEE